MLTAASRRSQEPAADSQIFVLTSRKGGVKRRIGADTKHSPVAARIVDAPEETGKLFRER
jgi:hypothetical protein